MHRNKPNITYLLVITLLLFFCNLLPSFLKDLADWWFNRPVCWWTGNNLYCWRCLWNWVVWPVIADGQAIISIAGVVFEIGSFDPWYNMVRNGYFCYICNTFFPMQCTVSCRDKRLHTYHIWWLALMSSSACMGCGWGYGIDCDGSPCGVVDDDHGHDCCWHYVRCGSGCHLDCGFSTSWIAWMTGMWRAFRVNLICLLHDPLWWTWSPLVNLMKQFLLLAPHNLDWARVATTRPQL